MRIGVAIALVMDDDPDECERVLDGIDADGDRGQLGSRMLLAASRAEVALARGDVTGGLAQFDEAVDQVATLEGTGMGVNPWLSMAASGALVAHVRFGRRRRRLTGPRAPGAAQRALRGDGRPAGVLDFPFSGVMLVGLAAWSLRWGPGSSSTTRGRCWPSRTPGPTTAASR